MNRFLSGLLVALAVVLSGGAASAQFPPGPPFPPPGPPPSVPPVYPPRPPIVVLDGQLPPRGIGFLNVGGASPHQSFPAVINSHSRIAVTAASDGDGNLHYNGFTVPADFELNATHRITWEDGSFLTFCVDGAGIVISCGALSIQTAPTQTGNLVRTGSDTIEIGVRAGVALVGGGALFLLWRRRRLVAG